MTTGLSELFYERELWVETTAGFRAPRHLAEQLEQHLEAEVQALDDGFSADKSLEPVVALLVLVELFRSIPAWLAQPLQSYRRFLSQP